MTEEQVTLNIPSRPDLPPQVLEQYSNCVKFMAWWCKTHAVLQEGEGLEFDEVITTFSENVTRVLIGETKGSA